MIFPIPGFHPWIFFRSIHVGKPVILSNFGHLTQFPTVMPSMYRGNSRILHNFGHLLWMDESLHHLRTPWNDDSPSKHHQTLWFPMVSKWCQMDFAAIHGLTPEAATDSKSRSRFETSARNRSLMSRRGFLLELGPAARSPPPMEVPSELADIFFSRSGCLWGFS